MELVVVKIIVLLCLGIIKLGSGLMPLLLVRLLRKSSMKWIDNFMAGLMCIGGGVLLATVFIHMLPEVRSSLEDVRIDNGGDPQEHTYPFAGQCWLLIN
jgi:zinc transporter 1/2/3